MGKSSLSTAIDLLDKISKVDPAVVARAAKAREDEQVRAYEPEPDLVSRREPGFIASGYSGMDITALLDAVIGGENVAISGPKGAGKSAMAFHLVDELNESTRVKNRAVWEENKKRIKTGAGPDDLLPYTALPYPVEHMSCSLETRVAEIIGDSDLVYDEQGRRQVVIRWGHVVEAWTKGRMLIVEEPDMADPGVWAGSHQFFDGRTTETSVFVNGSQTIRKHRRFRLIATMNTLGRGENQEEYAGTKVMNTAWANRFGYVVVLDYMKPEVETIVVSTKTGINKSLAEMMVSVAVKSREAHKEGVVEAPITTRDVLAWARECARAGRRNKVAEGDRDMWQLMAVESAKPAFINREPDDATRKAYETYLTLR